MPDPTRAEEAKAGDEPLGIVSAVHEAREAAEAFARANPHTAIGIALGFGFVLGGGLTPRLLLGIGALAVRTLARDYAKERLSSVAKAVAPDTK